MKLRRVHALGRVIKVWTTLHDEGDERDERDEGDAGFAGVCKC